MNQRWRVVRRGRVWRVDWWCDCLLGGHWHQLKGELWPGWRRRCDAERAALDQLGTPDPSRPVGDWGV